jgi:GNAT superfamily N-acetyltransferase
MNDTPATGRVRRATSADAPEFLRLRKLMHDAFGEPDSPGPWEEAALKKLHAMFADPEGDTAGFVIDGDQPGELAATVLGVIDERLPSPRNPSGRLGYVFSVSTAPAYRRRGYARAAMVALLDWFERQGVSTVDLTASEFGEKLYRELGFADRSSFGVALRRNRPAPEPAPEPTS